MTRITPLRPIVRQHPLEQRRGRERSWPRPPTCHVRNRNRSRAHRHGEPAPARGRDADGRARLRVRRPLRLHRVHGRPAASTPPSTRSTRSGTSRASIATRRGVRIASWLGDGAMLIGTEVGPAIAAAAELIARYDANTLALRGGIADGWALLFDGDDYIGRPVNLAARLSQAARPGRAARHRLPVGDLPGVDAGAGHPRPDPAGPRTLPAGPAARPRPRHRAPGALSFARADHTVR